MLGEKIMSEKTNWKAGFFTIAIGQTVSLIGSSAVQFAMIWWMAKETSSPIVLSLAGLVAFLPQIVLGPFAGVWIDRMKRKYVVIGADLFMGAVAAIFAGCFAVMNPPVWTACLVLGVRAVGNVFHQPAIQAVIPQLVPNEELVKANGWSQFMQSGAFMLGPVIGALMFGALPMEVILLTDLLGAIAASTTVAVTKIPESGDTGVRYPDFKAEFQEGIEVYRKDRKLLCLLMAATLSMVCFLPLSSLYPLMSSAYFQVSAFYGGLVEFMYAFGMMLSALIIGMVTKGNNKLQQGWLGLAGLAVTTLICGVLPSNMTSFWIFAVVCGLMGACANIYGIPVMAYMQGTIEPDKLGRAFSLLGTVMSLAMPLGLLVAGPCAEQFGVNAWFLISGIVMSLAIAVMWMIERKVN